LRSNLILRSFWLPTGDFRLARLPYSMILVLRVPLLGRKIALRQVKALYGGPSPERERVIMRMCQLGESTGEVDQLLRGLVSLCSVYFLRGEPARGLELARRCLELSKRTADLGLLADAIFMAGNLAFTSGNLREALSHQEAAALHSGGIGSSVGLYGFIRGSSIAYVRAQVVHLLGRVSEGAKIAEEGLRQVREIGHFPTLVITLALKAILYHMRREPRIACGYGEEAVALPEEAAGFISLHLGRVANGCALAGLEQFNRAIAEMEAGIGTLRNSGGAPRLDYYTAILAQSYAKTGQIEKGLKMLDEALVHIEHTGEKVDHAEMLRLKGEMLLMRDHSAANKAEKCFREAIDVSRAQEAKWWELRSSVSLAHLLRDTNRRDEARTMLSDIYNWFTEGFELPDLQDARALLEELS
jgi:hypothetical protein